MKVSVKMPSAFKVVASTNSLSRLIRSILLSARMASRPDSFRRADDEAACRHRSICAPRPPVARQGRRRWRPATRRPPWRVQAASSERKMPGVSMKTIWLSPSVAMPSTRVRVVWTRGKTIDTFNPMMLFNSVDLPAFGAPTAPRTRSADVRARIPAQELQAQEPPPVREQAVFLQFIVGRAETRS